MNFSNSETKRLEVRAKKWTERIRKEEIARGERELRASRPLMNDVLKPRNPPPISSVLAHFLGRTDHFPTQWKDLPETDRGYCRISFAGDPVGLFLLTLKNATTMRLQGMSPRLVREVFTAEELLAGMILFYQNDDDVGRASRLEIVFRGTEIPNIRQLESLARSIAEAEYEEGRLRKIHAGRVRGGSASKERKGILNLAIRLVEEHPDATANALFESVPESFSAELNDVQFDEIDVYRDGEQIIQMNRNGAEQAIGRATFRRYVTKARKAVELRSK